MRNALDDDNNNKNNLNNDSSNNNIEADTGISLNDREVAEEPASPSPSPEPDNPSGIDNYAHLSVEEKEGQESIWLKAGRRRQERGTDMRMKDLQFSPVYGALYGGRTNEEINRDSKLKRLANLVFRTMCDIERLDGSNNLYPGEVNLARAHYNQHAGPFALPRLMLNEEEEERVNWLLQDFIENNPGISDKALGEKIRDILVNAYQAAGKARVRERTEIAVLVRVEKYFKGISSNYPGENLRQSF